MQCIHFITWQTATQRDRGFYIDFICVCVCVCILFFFLQMLPGDQTAEGNFSSVMAFVLLGFSHLLNLQGLLFGIFFLIYIFILTGNSLIIIITRVDPVLQTPLYFFLANFSSLEIYLSVTLPRILVTLWTQDRSVSSLSCAIRRFFLAPGALLLGARPVSCASTCSLCAALCSRPTGRACSRLLAPGCGNSSPHGTDIPGVLTALLCFTADRGLLLWYPPLITLACGDTALNKFVSMRLLRCLPWFLSSWYWALMSKSFLPSESCAQPQAGPKPSPPALPISPLCFYSLAPWLLLIYAPNQIIPQEPTKCSLFPTLLWCQCLTPWYTVFRTKDVIAALKKLLLKKTLKIWKVTF